MRGLDSYNLSACELCVLRQLFSVDQTSSALNVVCPHFQSLLKQSMT